MFDQIWYNRLKVWDEAGFRQGYFTVDNIFVLHLMILKSLNEKKPFYCAYIDLKKAFNSVYIDVMV